MDPATLQNITQAQYAEPELNVSNNNLNEDTTNLSKDSPCVDTCILKESCNHQALENTSQPNTDVDSVSIETEARKENIKLKDANSNFEKAFLLPKKYLPKKKRAKLEKKGKPKLPAFGTGDAWLKILEEQENERKIKEEKIAKKKELQAAKKQIAQEKKKLDQKMEEIAL